MKAGSKVARAAAHKAAIAAKKAADKCAKRRRQLANSSSSRARRLARRAQYRETIASVAADLANSQPATPAAAESLVDALAVVAAAQAGANALPDDECDGAALVGFHR